MIDLERALADLQATMAAHGWPDRPIREHFYFYVFVEPNGHELLLAIEARGAPKGEKYLWTGTAWVPGERQKL